MCPEEDPVLVFRNGSSVSTPGPLPRHWVTLAPEAVAPEPPGYRAEGQPGRVRTRLPVSATSRMTLSRESATSGAT